jgi:hypothetical protein
MLACGVAPAGGPRAPKRPKVEARDTRILHEDCPVNASEAKREDINGDGRPDRVTAREGSGALCRSLDFNFDGAIDAWVYFEPSGTVRRRESDYDRDGRIDEVELYERGVLVERQRATSLAGKLDTWQYYTRGKVTRAERDANGDEYIDQWWEYPAGRSEECPLIHSDVNGDGYPDPGATVDVCRDQSGSNAAAPAAGDAPSVGDVPTEVEETPAAAEPTSATPASAPAKADGAP